MYETSCFDTAAPCVGYSPVALECGTHSDGECAFLHKVLLLLLHSPSVLVSGSECKIAVLEGDAAAQLTRDAPLGYTSMAMRLRNGEARLSNEKTKYLEDTAAGG